METYDDFDEKLSSLFKENRLPDDGVMFRKRVMNNLPVMNNRLLFVKLFIISVMLVLAFGLMYILSPDILFIGNYFTIGALYSLFVTSTWSLQTLLITMSLVIPMGVFVGLELKE